MTHGDAAISVTQAPQDLCYEVGFAKRLRSLPEVVVPNGAIYAVMANSLYKGESLTSGIVYGYEMPKERSLDIDNGTDMEIARMLVSKGLTGGNT
jgi:CMP-N-acetylneuraminic acid synthetase